MLSWPFPPCSLTPVPKALAQFLVAANRAARPPWLAHEEPVLHLRVAAVAAAAAVVVRWKARVRPRPPTIESMARGRRIPPESRDRLVIASNGLVGVVFSAHAMVRTHTVFRGGDERALSPVSDSTAKVWYSQR